MSMWRELGIDATDDATAIRRAYARKLKVTQPEDDPEGFQRLREAYEQAMRYVARRQAAQDHDEDDHEDGLDGAEGEAIARAVVSAIPPDAAPERPATPEEIEFAEQRARIEADCEAMLADLATEDPDRWADARVKLKRILASPALDGIEFRDAIEGGLAHHIARFLPRSDGLIEPAMRFFGWDNSAYRQSSQAVAWIIERRNSIELAAAMRYPGHDFHVGWMALTDAGAPGWRRRISAFWPPRLRQVGQLIAFADGDQTLHFDMAENAVTWWRNHLSRPRIEDSYGAILVAIGFALLGLGAIPEEGLFWMLPALGAAIVAGIAQALLIRPALARWMADRPWTARDELWFVPLLLLPLIGPFLPLSPAGLGVMIGVSLLLLVVQDTWLTAYAYLRAGAYSNWWKDSGGWIGLVIALFFAFGAVGYGQACYWATLLLGFVVGWCRGEERAMRHLSGLSALARRSLLILVFASIAGAVALAFVQHSPVASYRALVLVCAAVLPISFCAAFEDDGLRQVLLIAIRLLLIVATVMLHVSEPRPARWSQNPVGQAPPEVQVPPPPPPANCDAMPEADRAKTGPRPYKPCGKMAEWTNWADYPAAAARRNAQGMTQFAGIITPEGRFSQCRIIKSSGHADLDTAACTLFESRARFLPARDPRGKAIEAPFRMRFTWALSNDDQPPVPVKVESHVRTELRRCGVDTPGGREPCPN